MFYDKCSYVIYIYLFMIEIKMVPLALITTIHGLYADNVYNCKNIDSYFWVLCSIIVIIVLNILLFLY